MFFSNSDKTTTQPQKTTDTILTKIVITAMFTDKTTKATHTEHHGIITKIESVLVATILGVIIPTCIFCLLCMYLKKGKTIEIFFLLKQFHMHGATD